MAVDEVVGPVLAQGVAGGEEHGADGVQADQPEGFKATGSCGVRGCILNSYG